MHLSVLIDCPLLDPTQISGDVRFRTADKGKANIKRALGRRFAGSRVNGENFQLRAATRLRQMRQRHAGGVELQR